MSVLQALLQDVPPPTMGSGRKRSQLRWAGRQWNSVADLVAWMNRRGQHTSVAQFLQNHPNAFERPNYQGAAEAGGGAAGVVGGLGGGMFHPIDVGPRQMVPFTGQLPGGGGQHFLPPPIHRPQPNITGWPPPAPRPTMGGYGSSPMRRRRIRSSRIPQSGIMHLPPPAP